MPKVPYKGSNRSAHLPSNWQQLRRVVLRRDKGVCQIKDPGCRVRATEVDHIEPGDDHTLTNLRAACRQCHAKKSGREGGKASANVRQSKPEAHPSASYLNAALADLALIVGMTPTR